MPKTFNDLLEGCRYTQQNTQELYSKLAMGQHPIALVITCSDSRVDPALIMHCDPGELFVLRNIANLVPPYDPKDEGHSAVGSVLRYAVRHLHIPHLIVMGHSHCGGIKTCLQMIHSQIREEYLSPWLEILKPTAQRIIDENPTEPLETQAKLCEKASILTSLQNLMTYPWIQEKVKTRILSVHGFYFEIEKAAVSQWNEEKQQFESLLNL